MPGRFEPLADILHALQVLGIERIVCLTPLDEICDKSPAYARAIEQGLPVDFDLCPISDFGLPAQRNEFLILAQAVAAGLRTGKHTLVHCAAGIGRTGTFASTVALQLGLPFEQAIALVRAAGSSPDTVAQLALVATLAEQNEWRLEWAHGKLSVQAMGGMLAPVHFELGADCRISPLQVAPWAAAQDPTLPGILRGLRGEWPCVPFGMAAPPAGLPPDWLLRESGDQWDHGYSANHPWTLESATGTRLQLVIDYPTRQAIERLQRIVTVDPAAPSVTVDLIVHARRAVVLPVALHPTFAMPDGGVELVRAECREVHAYPIAPEPGVSRLIPGGRSRSLEAMPASAGPLDLTRLPLPFPTEELLQLRDAGSPVVLRYPHWGAEVLLEWDTAMLPDALLWISNGGRRQAPWNGRHFALGIEPVNGFFDLGRVVEPPRDHPLAHRRGLQFLPGQPRSIRYRLSARRVPPPAGG